MEVLKIKPSEGMFSVEHKNHWYYVYHLYYYYQSLY